LFNRFANWIMRLAQAFQSEKAARSCDEKQEDE
jgi:hypothetical protein